MHVSRADDDHVVSALGGGGADRTRRIARGSDRRCLDAILGKQSDSLRYLRSVNLGFPLLLGTVELRATGRAMAHANDANSVTLASEAQLHANCLTSRVRTIVSDQPTSHSLLLSSRRAESAPRTQRASQRSGSLHRGKHPPADAENTYASRSA